LRVSSKRALSSTKSATSFFRSSARVSASTMGDRSPTRYSVRRIATTAGSSAASEKKRTVVSEKRSNGW
jgi:hypothetical protein